MAASVRTYRDLVAWQKAIELTEATYRHTNRFPAEERFGLTSQIRRSAVSVPSNIAEGHGRQTRAAYLNFLRIARGSLRELETQLIVAQRVRIADEADTDRLLERCDEVGRVLHSLISKLEAHPDER